jgi:predicted lipoprotein with Yx(FWY)xxD motif
MRQIWGATGLAVIALAVAACGSSSSSSSAPGGPAAAGSGSAPAASSSSSSSSSSGTTLDAKTIGGKKLLTNSKGFTLYWFAPDTSTKSVCNGSCATYWPPVPGPATAGPGVTGKIGTITRSDGTQQATYNGHPLYTYVADKAPGQDKGNGLNVSGGLWYDVPVSASAAPASSSSSSSGGGGGGGGGYGY